MPTKPANAFAALATACVVAFGLFVAPAQAGLATYEAALSGLNEVPANVSQGYGEATITLDFDLLTMRVEAIFADLTGDTTAAHIHCCTPPGSNVGVATQLPTFSGFPLGVQSGSYDHTFDMTSPLSFNPAFITNHGGTVGSAFTALVAGLDSGQAYFNIHTNTNPGGEIRGNLARVPEPATVVLLGVGLAGLAASRRRKQ